MTIFIFKSFLWNKFYQKIDPELSDTNHFRCEIYTRAFLPRTPSTRRKAGGWSINPTAYDKHKASPLASTAALAPATEAIDTGVFGLERVAQKWVPVL